MTTPQPAPRTPALGADIASVTGLQTELASHQYVADHGLAVSLFLALRLAALEQSVAAG